MRLHRGVHQELEAEADRILKEELNQISSPAAKSDILTPWKEQDRRRHEIYVASGTPDPAYAQGIFHRGVNRDAPHLNSVPPGRTARHARGDV